ncbi:hypothetical protein ACHAPT_004296 [Fusarium lateritium]
MPLPTPVSPASKGPSPPCLTDETNTERLTDRDLCITAIDFGTTASGVSWVKVPRGCSPESINSSSIRSIGNFPDVGTVCQQDEPTIYKVPTEVIYSSKSRFYQQEEIGSQEETAETNPEDYSSMLNRNPFRDVRHDLEEEEVEDDCWQFEIVLCVPAIWDPKALRIMQTSLAAAMDRARFPGVDIQNNSIENLFIVSEPEAAATFMVDNKMGFRYGDTVVLLDAGGGTVDAVTYQIESQLPLRLSKEVVPHGGGLCGSSYFNEYFREHLLKLLENQTQLEINGVTIRGIVENIMTDIEYKGKRRWDIFRDKGKFSIFVSSHLKPGPSIKGPYVQIPAQVPQLVSSPKLTMRSDVIEDMFLKVFFQIGEILENQIVAASNYGRNVNVGLKLLHSIARTLTRWYAESRPDRRLCRLRFPDKMAGISVSEGPMQAAWASSDRVVGARQGLEVRMRLAVNAVSRGAILRALGKKNGPMRFAKSSYGFLRSEPWGDYRQHSRQRYCVDRNTGEYYVWHTIYWVLKKGKEIKPNWVSPKYPVVHHFDYDEALICREVIYVSDTATESHYQAKHRKNKDAQVAGTLEVDFSFLRDQGLLEPIDPELDENGKPIGKRHWTVEFQIQLKVIGRDLSCIVTRDEQVINSCRINIAPGFDLGTM